MLFMKESQSLRFVRFNRAGEDLLGWPRQYMIGKSDYDFWPQAQADFFVEKDRETLKSGTVVDIPEEPIHTRHQGVRLLHTKKVPIRDAAGHPTYLLGISEDITERRRIEKDQQFLAEASVLLSASLDYEQTLVSLAQLVVQHIADWCVVDVMDEDGRLSRLKVASADPTKAALCAVLEQMPPNRDLPHFVRSVSEGGRPITIEHVTTEWVESFAQAPEHLQAILATGVLSLIAVPLVMRGQRLGVLVFGSSTPSRVYGPGDLRAAAALADRATVAIEHARLYRLSREATELRERVLGIVAHDLRNPLAAIRIQTSFLKRRAPEPERRSQKPVDAINSVAIRMDRLIQDLLSAALIEVGELTMQPTRLSTSRLMTEAVDVERPVASSSSVELQLDVEPDMRDLWADHDRLLQVFENLISNAIKFTSPGGRITVGAESREDEVLFWVADTGCGISPGDLPQIFDRFWRATDRTGRLSAGLGLHITKGIVEAHGGRIWVESRQGLGTTFFFTMPVVTSPGARN
jgi:PAS domain S-box-containing protein